MSANSLVFHTSGRISSSPRAFPFLIFLRTELSSSCVSSPSLMSSSLLIIFVISSCVTFVGFPSTFSKCCFHRCFYSWLVAFSLAFALLFLLLTSFTVCYAIVDCLSSTVYISHGTYASSWVFLFSGPIIYVFLWSTWRIPSIWQGGMPRCFPL